ncbi:MAG: hypothetical protein HY089_03200 [Ignavibacteriales bacterium]|nr:hypothetical protein [Ignavibacteriales bacterium]
MQKKVVINSDILLEHLTLRYDSSGEGSVLRRAMSLFFCYTTVFNAIELFALARTEAETHAVEHVMQAMKILGLNGKSAKNVGPYIAQGRRDKNSDMNALIAGLCTESRLPILTRQPRKFKGLGPLRVIPAGSLGKYSSAEEIVQHAIQFV